MNPHCFRRAMISLTLPLSSALDTGRKARFHLQISWPPLCYLLLAGLFEIILMTMTPEVRQRYTHIYTGTSCYQPIELRSPQSSVSLPHQFEGRAAGQPFFSCAYLTCQHVRCHHSGAMLLFYEKSLLLSWHYQESAINREVLMRLLICCLLSRVRRYSCYVSPSCLIYPFALSTSQKVMCVTVCVRLFVLVNQHPLKKKREPFSGPKRK